MQTTGLSKQPSRERELSQSYCIYLNLTRIYSNKEIKIFHCRATKIVYKSIQPNAGKIQSVFGIIRKLACTFVRKCLAGVMNESFMIIYLHVSNLRVFVQEITQDS